MPVRQVQSHARSAASPQQAWAVVRDFCAPWHPLVAQMVPERAPDGGLLRRFTVKGESTVYRERLTWFSDSERSMAYTHIDGIAGAHSYLAQLSVAANGQGAVITMQADIDADAGRVDEIAEGTQAIFDSGTQIIADLAFEAAPEVPAAWPSLPLQEFHIKSAPHLALSVVGEPGNTLCLFLHGIGGNRTNWDVQLAAAGAQTCAAALDLRGYGGSALGADPSDVDSYCGDILRVMEALGASRLILCGLSYGAWLATSFAMRHPEVLAGLVLSGGCTGMSEASPEQRAAFRASREAPLQAGQTPADFAPAVVEAISGPDAPDTARAALLASMQSIPAATYADAVRCFTNPMDLFDFSKLNLPVLMMTGAHDTLAPPDEIRSVATRIWNAHACPDVRFEVIAGAGHVCNLEQPTQYNRILLEFITRVLG